MKNKYVSFPFPPSPQPSLSLDYSSVETILLKNEGDFISVEQGKELSRKKKQQREENMRQLLDVTNTLTTEEIKDFEMRWVNYEYRFNCYRSTRKNGQGSLHFSEASQMGSVRNQTE